MTSDTGRIDTKAATVVETYRQRRLTLATAESCTGGLVAGALTSVSGSSAVLDRGFVTYSNAAKIEMLGVEESVLHRHGAVSKAVAIQMAEGARKVCDVAVAVSITGIAGPGGGSDEKPIGLVHFACASESGTRHVERRFGALERDAIRQMSVATALELLLAEVRDD